MSTSAVYSLKIDAPGFQKLDQKINRELKRGFRIVNIDYSGEYKIYMASDSRQKAEGK